MTSKQTAIAYLKRFKTTHKALINVSKHITHLKALKATTAILKQYRFYTGVKFELKKL